MFGEETTIYAQCVECLWTSATATPSPAAVRAATNDLRRAALSHAWTNEGHVTRVFVNGSPRSTFVRKTCPAEQQRRKYVVVSIEQQFETVISHHSRLDLALAAARRCTRANPGTHYGYEVRGPAVTIYGSHAHDFEARH